MSELRASNLRKRYRSRVVVQDVSISVSSGQVVGLLGPNGAGKTTCFYMIVGLVAVDGGRIMRIAPAGSIQASGAAQLIDGKGKFVVPGFNDMHYHVLDFIDTVPNYWPLMVANGITGYRGMSGSPEHL